MLIHCNRPLKGHQLSIWILVNVSKQYTFNLFFLNIPTQLHSPTMYQPRFHPLWSPDTGWNPTTLEQSFYLSSEEAGHFWWWKFFLGWWADFCAWGTNLLAVNLLGGSLVVTLPFAILVSVSEGLALFAIHRVEWTYLVWYLFLHPLYHNTFSLSCHFWCYNSIHVIQTMKHWS